VNGCLIDYDTEEEILYFNVLKEPESEVKNAMQYVGELTRTLRDMLINPGDPAIKFRASELLNLIVGYIDPEENT
jgi:hypothetical protein